MTAYVDTSALAKLVVAETETPALRAWLAARPGRHLITNAIGAVELHRMAARVSREASSAATMLLARVDLLALTPGALSVAAHLPPPEVRTLDALHIGSASEIDDLDAVLTYDLRMAEAASAYGLPVVTPL